MRRIPFLLLALGLVAGLMACQDGGVVAPDDAVVSADDLVVAAGKPAKPGGGKPSKGGTAMLTLAVGMVYESLEGLRVVSDDDRSLQVHGTFGIRNNLASTFGAFTLGNGEDGIHGACKTSPAASSVRNALMTGMA